MSAVSTQGLNGAVVLVTGAHGDIGRVACAALTYAGARVIGSGRGSAGDDLRVDAWMRHDVTCADDWTRIAEEIRLRFGRLDCLVNAAGVSMVESIAGISIEQWRHAMAVNVESVLRGLQALLPLLRQGGYERPGGSSVVNISSVAGVRGVPFNAAYSASKGAVTLLSKSAAKEFALLKYPIRVNCVNPGALEGRMMSSIVARYAEIGLASTTEAEAEATRLAIASRSPLGRRGMPEEVAGAIVFLCSPAASFMTGAEIVIDGGSSA